MKKYLVHFTIILAVLLSVQSCDSYLEQVDPNSISADVFWSDLDESNSNLNAVYGSLLNQLLWGYDVEAWRSDVGFPQNRKNLFGSGREWYQKQFNDATKEIGQEYDALYQVIWRANQLIEGLEGMDETFKSQEEWKHQMGQARFFRGLIHFYLYSTFNGGSIIIRNKVPVAPADFLIPVSTPEAVIDFVRKDLKYAYDNLPYQFEQKTRANKGFAAAELGKTYLHTGNYPEAMVYLSEVINNPAYGLQLLNGNDVSLLFTHAGDFNSESIFELNYGEKNQIEDSNWDEQSFFNRWARESSIDSRSDFVPSAWLTYLYANEPMDSQDPRNYIDDGNGTRFRSVPLRCAQMIAVVNDEESEVFQSLPANAKYSFGGTKFSHFKKFSNHDIAASEEGVLSTSWKSGKNVFIKRLPEVYLNLAECQAQTGDIDGAIKSINAVRQRWGLVSLGVSDGSAHDFDEVDDYTTETIMDHLMYVEYPLELSVEGHNIRTTDLRRWGIAKARFTELSQTEFHLDDYTSLNGEIIRKASLIKKGPAVIPDDTIVEFGDSAKNYVEGLHDYFPLPLSEKLNNPAVNN